MKDGAFVLWVAGAAVLAGVLAGILPAAWGHLATALLLTARFDTRTPPPDV